MRCLWVDDDKPIDRESYRKNYGFREEEPVLIARNFKEALYLIDDHYQEFDAVILDINLSTNFSINEDMYQRFFYDIIPKEKFWLPDLNAIPGEEKLNDDAKLLAGYYLYLYLLHRGFPKDRIVFLSAYAGPEMLSDEEIYNQKRSALNLIRNFLSDDNFLSISQDEFDRFLEAFSREYEEMDSFDVVDQVEYLSAVFDDKDVLKKQLQWCLDKIANLEAEKKEQEQELNALPGDMTQELILNLKTKFSKIGIKIPHMIRKNNYEAFIKWKKEKDTDYYQLRGGIIEACLYLKNELQKQQLDFIFLHNFVEKWNEKEAQKRFTVEYFAVMLDSLQSILPLRESHVVERSEESNQDCERKSHQPISEKLYLQIIRTIAHDWEMARGNNYNWNNIDYNPKRTFGNIMKLLRNWVAHNKLQHFDVNNTAFYFVVAMRTFFKLERTVQSYEKILLGVINENPCGLPDLIKHMPCQGDPKIWKLKNAEQQNAEKDMEDLLSKSLMNLAGKCDRKSQDNSTISTLDVFDMLDTYGYNKTNLCSHLMLNKLLWHGIFYGKIQYGRLKFNFEDRILPSKDDKDILTYMYRYTLSSLKEGFLNSSF